MQDALQKFNDSWDLLDEHCLPVKLQIGQSLFYQGHVPSGVFIVRSGTLEFRKNGKAIGQANLNEPIGLEDLLQGNNHPFDAVAITEVDGCFISKNDLEKIL